MGVALCDARAFRRVTIGGSPRLLTVGTFSYEIGNKGSYVADVGLTSVTANRSCGCIGLTYSSTLRDKRSSFDAR